MTKFDFVLQYKPSTIYSNQKVLKIVRNTSWIPRNHYFENETADVEYFRQLDRGLKKCTENVSTLCLTYSEPVKAANEIFSGAVSCKQLQSIHLYTGELNPS